MKVDYDQLKQTAIEMLRDRGVELIDIARITYELQKKYYEDLTLEDCLDNVLAVLDKREVINTVMTGIELDRLVEEGYVREPLRSILLNDYSLYGIDEVLAYSIVNVYGSIGLTNFGYVDKIKLGIISDIDEQGKNPNRCNTFLDDIVGAIAAAAASRIAHAR
ncbi:MAG TPA: phosphatidylglycerophosphatase A [Haloplasmataceae bacterium]